jgi:hypothetical protein
MIGPTKLYDSSGNFTMQFVGTAAELANVPVGVWVPKEGDIWYDTTAKTLKIYKDGSWDNPYPLTNGVDLKGNGGIEGVITWNDDDGTIDIGLPGGQVNLQVGQEMLVRVTNDTAIDIPDGTPVYISDASGTNIKVKPADADFDEAVGLRTFAVTTELIEGSQKGYVTTQGFVRDIDTSFAVAAGLPAYLKVGGGFTTTPPDAPDIAYLMGIVTIAHAESGELYVIQTSLPNLVSLSDVLITNLQDGQVLQWEAASSVWKNVTLT